MQDTQHEALPEAIYRALGPADALEFSVLVAGLPREEWGVAHYWSPTQLVAVTAVLKGGRFETWQLYPCRTEEDAAIMGERSAAMAKSAIALQKRSEAAADAALQRARRLN